MAKSYEVQADWRELNPATLPEPILAAYETYKEAQRLAAEYREKFEAAMSSAAALPSGQRLAFGYRFGKLSIAVIPDDRPAKRPSTQAQSLADFLKAQALTGARS